jgi:hypothetical protein
LTEVPTPSLTFPSDTPLLSFFVILAFISFSSSSPFSSCRRCPDRCLSKNAFANFLVSSSAISSLTARFATNVPYFSVILQDMYCFPCYPLGLDETRFSIDIRFPLPSPTNYNSLELCRLASSSVF